MGSISVRMHIHWPPAPAEEPTSTLVLTSPGRRFVDLRILKFPLGTTGNASGESEEEISIPISRLDWGIAGTSSSWKGMVEEASGREVTHSRWTHWIDSRTRRDPETCVVDEGDIFPQPGGTTLEKGRMVNLVTGLEADYEELWADLELGDETRCVVLLLDDPDREARGMIVILGRFCQGILRTAGNVSAERWESGGAGEGGEGANGWRLRKKIGDCGGVLVCDVAVDRLASWVVGEELRRGGFVWHVVEAA